MIKWVLLIVLIARNEENMQLAQMGILGGRRTAQRDVFLAIGDSNSAGKGAVVGPVTAPGVMFKWNGSSLDNIITTDISTNPGGPYGTMYKQFANDYYLNTGRSVVIVPKGSSGASIYPSGDNNNWYTSGTLYADAVTEANQCLAYVGASALTGIIVWCGINDSRRSAALADVNTGIQSLVSRLISDFPGVPILFAQVGVEEVNALLNNPRQYSIRRYIRNAVRDNADCHFFSNPASFWKIGTSGDYYNLDNLHMEQAGLNIMGAQIARWYKYSSYSKDARSCIAASMGEMSSGQRTALATFIDSQVTSGNYDKLEMLVAFKTFTRDNIYMDYAFMCGTTDNIAAPTFTANQNTYFDGVDDTYAGVLIGSFDGQNASYPDFIIGALIDDNDSANPSSAALFGRQTISGAGNSIIMIRQNAAGNISYFAQDATGSLGTIARFTNGNVYSVGRSSGNKYFYEDSTQNATAAVALGVGTPGSPYIANYRIASTSNQLMTGGYSAYYAAKHSTFNLSSFITALKTYIAAI